jgi:putative NADH-flavin reductase
MPMTLTVVAASGRIGGRIVEQALAARHQVTAVVRDPTKVAADVRVVAVDFLDPDRSALESAIEEADAVLSGLGRGDAWRRASPRAGRGS